MSLLAAIAGEGRDTTNHHNDLPDWLFLDIFGKCFHIARF